MRFPFFAVLLDVLVVVPICLLRKIRAGVISLLYVSPERFNNERFIRALKGVKVALFVVDEAHCISEVHTLVGLLLLASRWCSVHPVCCRLCYCILPSFRSLK